MKSKMKTIGTILVLAIGIPLLVLALQQSQLFTPKASSLVPKQVVVSNVTDTTATISWITPEGETLTNLSWGVTKALGNIEVDDTDKIDNTSAPRNIHSVTLTELAPGSEYFFRITSGSVQYPSASEDAYTFKTLPNQTGTKPSTLTLYGDVPALETAAEDVIVLVFPSSGGSFKNASPFSVVTKTGAWYVNLGNARTFTGATIQPTKDSEFLLIALSQNKGYKGIVKTSQSPLTITLTDSLTDTYVADAVANTKATGSATPTPTVTQSTGSIPLLPIGATQTPTPIGGTTLPSNVPSKEQVLSSLITPAVSNITDSSLSISYLSYTKTQDAISYGASSSSLSKTVLDDLDGNQVTSRYLHHFTLTDLSPNNQFYFRSKIENILRTFTLPSRISFPAGTTIVSGTLKNAAGECFVRTQVVRGSLYSSPITTLPTGNTAWNVNIAPVRTNSLDTFMVPTATDKLINNAICVTQTGDILYAITSTTVQDAVTKGVVLQLQITQ